MNKKDKIKFAIIAVLVIVLLFAINNAGKAIRKAKKLRRKTLRSTILKEEESYKIPAEIQRDQAKGIYERLEEETKDLALQRDPFTRGRILRTKLSAPDLNLTGMLWDKQIPKVIINNEIFGVGDKVGPNTIVDIEQDRVILNDGSRDFELKFKEEFILKPEEK